MSKFNVGDIVALVNSCYVGIHVGDIGIVMSVSDEFANMNVFMAPHQQAWYFSESEFVHVHEYNKENTCTQ
jgi:hypothetical protein